MWPVFTSECLPRKHTLDSTGMIRGNVLKYIMLPDIQIWNLKVNLETFPSPPHPVTSFTAAFITSLTARSLFCPYHHPHNPDPGRLTLDRPLFSLFVPSLSINHSSFCSPNGTDFDCQGTPRAEGRMQVKLWSRAGIQPVKGKACRTAPPRKEVAATHPQNVLPFRRLGLLVSDHRIFHKHKSGSVLKYRPRYLYDISLTKETYLCVNLASRLPVCYSGPLVLESKFVRWIFRHWSTSLNLAEWHLAFSSDESYSPTSLSYPCSPLGSSLPSSPPTTDLLIFKSFSSDTFKNIVSTSYQL